jgi:hypothetical protein
VIPTDLLPELWLDETDGGPIMLSLDWDDRWRESQKQVWPLEALGS